jgi:hypothetical protein
MSDIVFLDIETTSLSADTGEVWEFAGIRRDEHGSDKGRLWCQIDASLSTADPVSLKIGKYYERFGQNGIWCSEDFMMDNGFVADDFYPEQGERVLPALAARLIAKFTRDAHIVGNVISFDAERLERLLRKYGHCPGWHYHIIDIEPMIVGHALANGHRFLRPYDSTDLTHWLGIAEPTEEERHPALGDAAWVMRQWDALHAIHLV